ncbi:24789_t:CDS:2, partial [Racocetra persica]
TTLIQSVPVSYFDDEYTLTPKDLPNSSPLLIYSASVVPNSYIPDNKGVRKVLCWQGIQKETSSTESPLLQSTSQAISTEPNTKTPIHLVPHVNENTTFTDDNDSTELVYTDTPVPQNEKLDNNRKRLRPLLSAKK